ncbi:cellulase family glycosylhydrolase [Amycolatopsis sp. NPDC059657]|uniref:cellulase family glycosylhydrolase n=1 Tax=Amycolatopsis sp. NPDC059657 TaxID=3346899 RepID=UPI00366D97AA
MKRTRVRACLRALLVAAVAVPLLAVPQQASADTNSFRGVNWADGRDNYVDGWVIPTGLASGDSYSAVKSKADGIISGFQSKLGANTVRLPINPKSVNSDWWARYKGAADSALGKGMKVIFGYWEANKDGKVDDTNAWNTMWDKVTGDYKGNGNVYFEPMNEPFGYSLNDWVSVCSGWLSRHSGISRGRVIISGTGYNDNVTGVGGASALNGTLLSLHFYGYWANDTTRAAWTTNLSNRLGSYSSRTIIDEAGAPMTTGLTYNGTAQDGNTFTAYFAATTELARSRRMGVVYWPGLRAGDSYSITRQSGAGLAVNNPSAVAQLRRGWGL